MAQQNDPSKGRNRNDAPQGRKDPAQRSGAQRDQSRQQQQQQGGQGRQMGQDGDHEQSRDRDQQRKG